MACVHERGGRREQEGRKDGGWGEGEEKRGEGRERLHWILEGVYGLIVEDYSSVIP